LVHAVLPVLLAPLVLRVSKESAEKPVSPVPLVLRVVLDPEVSLVSPAKTEKPVKMVKLVPLV